MPAVQYSTTTFTDYLIHVRKVGEAGPVDSGQVTLVFDDCKPTQAHGTMVGNLFRFWIYKLPSSWIQLGSWVWGL